MACSGATRPAAPINRTAGAAGDTSRPYKSVGFVGVTQSPAAPGISICRGGSITNRPYCANCCRLSEVPRPTPRRLLAPCILTLSRRPRATPGAEGLRRALGRLPVTSEISRRPDPHARRPDPVVAAPGGCFRAVTTGLRSCKRGGGSIRAVATGSEVLEAGSMGLVA